MLNLKQNIIQYKGLPREIYILFVGRVINCLGSFVTPLLALILTQKFGMSSSESGSFISLQSCIQGIGLIVGGKLVDSFGRKSVIVICQSLGAIVLILCGVMPMSILTAKLMMASSRLYSMAFPAYDALQADVTSTRNRKISYSLLYMGINIGFAIGPMLGGFLYNYNLSLVFMGDAITTLISMILVMTLIKEKKNIGTIEEVEEEKCLKDRNKLEDNIEGSVFQVLLKRPILILFGLILFFINFTYSQWAFALPLQMGKIFGSDGAKIYGLMGATNGLVVIIAMPFLMRLTKKLSELINIGLNAFIYCVTFLIFAFVRSLPLFFFGIVIMTLGEIMGVTNSSAFISNNSPASHRGRLSSVVSIMTGTGFALSPIVIGGIIDSYGMIQGYFVTAGSAAIAVILVAIARKLMKNNNYISNMTTMLKQE